MISKTARKTFNKSPSHFFKVLLSLLHVTLIIHNVAQIQSQLIDVLFSKEVCDPDEFFSPYVKVSKTRKGPIIKGIYETGKIIVSEYSGLLCINGPAFIYVDNNTEPQIFSHGCFAFNRRNMKDYQQETLPPLGKDTVVYGYKVYSVFLLAAPSDLRRTQFNWFRHAFFGHFPGDNVAVSGSSFGIVINDAGKSGTEVFENPPGPNSYCFEVASLNVFGKVTGIIQSGQKPQFCYQRGDESPPDEFYEVFQNGLLATEYNWIICPDPEPDGESTEIDDSNPKRMPDFRIIDPALLKALGSPGRPFKGKVVVKSSASIPFYSRPFPPGYYFKGEPGYKAPVTEAPDPDESGTTATESPLKKVKTELRTCEELPELASPCSEEPDAEKSCDILKHVLTIDEVNWNDTSVNLIVKANWRVEIMNIVVKIYQKVCPQVSKGLAPAVSRVVQYFIWKVATSAKTVEKTVDPPIVPGEIKHTILNTDKRKLWDDLLIKDLQRCYKNSEKMPFYRTRDVVNEIKKKELEKKLEEWSLNVNSTINIQELEDMMRDVHIQFPYFIWLPPPPSWNNITQIQVRGHIEAAEIDYNLDWAIDTFWKVFSTVLGYCNKHYTIRTGATFKQLYTYFSQDILDLVVEQWTQDAPIDGKDYIFGNFEKTYDQIFGEFVNGISSRYIDACNDGAYWWADVPDFRPVRPLYLKAGSTTGGSARPVNFFVEHPLFANSEVTR